VLRRAFVERRHRQLAQRAVIERGVRAPVQSCCSTTVTTSSRSTANAPRSSTARSVSSARSSRSARPRGRSTHRSPSPSDGRRPRALAAALSNLLEPRSLVERFLTHPPDDFTALVTRSGTPRSSRVSTC
jgi:hypothetical protein